MLDLCVSVQLGSTALDISRSLQFDEITDILFSKFNRETGRSSVLNMVSLYIYIYIYTE